MNLIKEGNMARADRPSRALDSITSRVDLKRSVAFVLLILAGVALVLVYLERSGPEPMDDASPPRHAGVDSGVAPQGARAIVDAFREKRSDVPVQSEGVVETLLADDLVGSRHQRFILRLTRDHTLLISHNIDLAPRVPLSEGDEVEFRGVYEWNARGGVVHWTHRDPDGRHPGGWIRLGAKRYE